MKKTLTLLALSLFSFSAFSQSNFGKLQGKITDSKSKAAIGFATIIVQKDGINKGGTYSDADGNYAISALEPGEYSVTVKFLDYSDKIVQGVTINSNSTKFLNIEMSQKDEATTIGPVVIKAGAPLIEKDKNTKTLSAAEITKLPTRSINAIAATSSGVTTAANGQISFLGGRTDGTAYYVDGVRIIGNNQGAGTQVATAQIDIIQSGIPAQYGDFTGGAINITTKGPTRYVRRSFEAISSGIFDANRYNQIEMSSSGPLWVKNKGGGLDEYVGLGYLAAGNLNYQLDPNPGYNGFYYVNESKLEEIKQNPLTPNPNGPGLIPTSTLLTKNDLVLENSRRNHDRYAGNFQLKLDFQPTKNSTLTAFGSYNYQNSKQFSYANTLMNYDENALEVYQTFRTYLKFTQRLQTETNPQDKKEDDEKPLFTDAYYNIRVDYQSQYYERSNPNHGDNLFDYGYLGQFVSQTSPFYQYNNTATKFVDQKGDTVVRQGFWELNGASTPTGYSFTQYDLNPARANYTRNFFEEQERQGIDVVNQSQVLLGLGLLNGFNANATYSLWTNPGTVAYFYEKTQDERAAVYAQGNATLNLKNSHDLQFGMYFEQNFLSRWAINANSLWVLMPQLANRHITSLDKTIENEYIVNGIHSYDEDGVFLDTVNYNIRIDKDQQSNFDKNLRDKLIREGKRDANGNLYTATSQIDVNSLTPQDVSLDLFYADDLWNNGNTYVAYYGYDYLGNRSRSRFGLNDFLNNDQSKSLGSFAPVYNALWLEDKFAYKDLVFRLGVRVERYDANQDVLKDQFSLYPTYSVDEVLAIDNDNLDVSSVPSNIGGDYVVYVDDAKNPTRILGFREGSKWYDENGTELTSSATIAQNSNSGTIQPYLVNDDETLVPESFEDYTPKINVLPRVWFSFPINNEAQFFANYDVLAQRPNDGLINSPYNQFAYLEFNQGAVLANPAMTPRIMTMYEFGFKQTLSRYSALSIIASYREQKGDFARVRIDNAYPVSYTSFSNIDFSTIKAFRAEYELRGEGRTSIALNYRLLFSSGTGSNQNSSQALLQAGLPNLRSLYPTEYDIRHQITSIIDYRFKGGKDYTGPVWFGKKVFSDAGANFIVTAKSGEPFSAYANAIPAQAVGVPTRQNLEGNPFGSRMPWQFKIDANFQKNFTVAKKTPKDKYRPQDIQIQVFVWVQNLLNTRIVQNVYGFTGLPNDDGWLSSPQGQQQLQSEISTQSYIDLYNAKVDYSYFYDIPRLTRVGVKLYF